MYVRALAQRRGGQNAARMKTASFVEKWKIQEQIVERAQ